MKLALFSSKPYDEKYFNRENKFNHEITFFSTRLNEQTLSLAKGYTAVCVFVNDKIDRAMIATLAKNGTQFIALRCAGFNNIDFEACKEFGIIVCRVPAYSPYAVAEHTAALMLTLNRRITRAYNRVKEGNFSLDGLLGFDIHGKTIGIIGTGQIGECFANIMNGFGTRLLFVDPFESSKCQSMGEYTDLDTLFKESDIISLHCPLRPETHHLINDASIAKMKNKVMILNTSRGALIDTHALIRGLKQSQLGSVGLDVYEEEAELFFEDCSDTIIQDDTFMRLTTFPNVIITGHQAFFTSTALSNIAETTLQNLDDLEFERLCLNLVE
ncbi:2-hydroxyacid dehydrogenase [Lentisphaera profundi]|uniref:2-hydroxyacid dehydrogenase n=1 Tax=Lentisphaera profundi TaxID=1658616 RepID=A0ABY7VMZ6_9BACT|nr:2-hydroxyacid dehydrogenase [Lentisphaera profundi]WDE95445.1 2-hydroxyacid dehydrogenase [Lentisphaera profundi]